MAAITPTKVVASEMAGDVKFKVFTSTLESASDTIDLSDYFTTIYYAKAVLTGGGDAALLSGLQTSFSSTTVTVVSKAEAGTASTNWDSATIRLLVLGVE